MTGNFPNPRKGKCMDNMYVAVKVIEHFMKGEL